MKFVKLNIIFVLVVVFVLTGCQTSGNEGTETPVIPQPGDTEGPPVETQIPEPTDEGNNQIELTEVCTEFNY